MNQPTSKEPYSLSPVFERAVVTLACHRPKFYARTAHAVDPELLASKVGKLALQAARAVAADLGNGPDSLLLVDQRLCRWREDGRVTQEQINEVSDYFEEAFAAKLPPEESVEAELLPILRKRMELAAVKAAMDDYGKRGDFNRTRELLDKSLRLGVTAQGTGVKLGSTSLDLIARLRQLKRIPTGIMELDLFLDGGNPRGTLNIWMAGTGGGKSVAMTHIAARNLVHGLHVAYATLELPEPVVLARTVSNLTGVTVTSIIESQNALERAKRRLEKMKGLGTFIVKEFTPQATTVNDIREWVLECEEAEGRPVDLLMIDYADKMTMPNAERTAQHVLKELVFEGLRIFADQKKLVCWTGTQSRGREERKSSKIDLEHTSEGMGKVRVADFVGTLNFDEDNNEMGFFVAKNRHGRSRQMVGPLPCDFSLGQIAPVMRDASGDSGGTAASL